MTLPLMRCPYCHGKSIEAQRTYTIQCGDPGPCTIVPPVHGLFPKHAIPPLPN